MDGALISKAILGDCMDVMRKYPDKYFDLAVVDPPYFSGPERRGYYGSKVSKIGVRRDYPISPKWDIPTREYFNELERVAKRYIVWGCNYSDGRLCAGDVHPGGPCVHVEGMQQKLLVLQRPEML